MGQTIAQISMNQREVTDDSGTTWTCVQALSGISEDAAKVEGEAAVWVVGTPSGGAKSVRLKLQPDWQTVCSDETLLHEIAIAQTS